MPVRSKLLRDHVVNALEHVEQTHQYLSEGNLAAAIAENDLAAQVLEIELPQHPDFANFQRKAAGPFYEAYIQLCSNVAHNVSIFATQAKVANVAVASIQRTSRASRPELNEPGSKSAELEQRFKSLRGAHGSTGIRDAPGRNDFTGFSAPLSRQSTVGLEPLATSLRDSTFNESHSIPGAASLDKGNCDTIRVKRKPVGGEGISLMSGLKTAQHSFVISAQMLSRLLVDTQNVLLLDVRHRDEFDRAHIKTPKIVGIDPVTLRPRMTVAELEDSLVLASDAELLAFADLETSPLIVFFDAATATFPPTANTPLFFLYSMLIQRGRRVLMLVGGHEAWVARGLPTASLHDAPLRNGLIAHSEHLSSLSTDAALLGPGTSSSDPGLALYDQVEGRPIPSKVYASRAPTPPMPDYEAPSIPGPPVPSKPYELKQAKLFPKGVSDPQGSTVVRRREMNTYQQPSIGRSDWSSDKTVHLGASGGSNSLHYTAVTPTNRQYQALATDGFVQNQDHMGFHSTQTQHDASRREVYGQYDLQATPRNPGPMLRSGPARFTTMAGLKNLGNTCYMNCILQCLFGTPELMIPFADSSYERHVNPRSRLGYSGRLAREFAVLTHGVMGQTRFVAPYGFKRLVGTLRDTFSGFEQQDCQEFLTFLLDGLHEDLNLNGNHERLPDLNEAHERFRERLSIRTASTIEWERYLKTNTSMVVDTFQGQYVSRLECTVCQTTSTTYNAFCTLSLPIASGSRIGLLDCFNLFVQPEILSGDDAWFCPHCKRKQKTIKTLNISRLPKILVIHLKRFKRSMFTVNKLETPVHYPLHNLDLTGFWPQLENPTSNDKRLDALPLRGQVPPFRYDLYGVTSHDGSLRSGHYTAFVKKPNRQWYYFDDTNVVPVVEQAVTTKNAYVLFYRRVDIPPEGL